jgi:hypothetical protein
MIALLFGSFNWSGSMVAFVVVIAFEVRTGIQTSTADIKVALVYHCATKGTN